MTLLARGKVRELHAAGPERLVIVASDRISAYDVVLPTPIPDKGRVLTALSVHWLEELSDIVPGHLLSTDPDELPAEHRAAAREGRAMLVQALRMLPLECVARGYLAGSGWRDYRASGAVCGHVLPEGLRPADRLPEPIFTPATKAREGHDVNIDREAAARLVGAATLDELERVTLAVYARAAERCAAGGIILADTKLELGMDGDGRLVLADEVVTPDSSRLWPADGWEPGGSPPSFDKQYVRDWLDASGWDHAPPAPELPPEVVEGARARYLEAHERIVGVRLDP